MNARRSTIVLIPRFVMNMESVNSRLDLRKMHDLDRRAKVEVTVHRDDLDPNHHLVDPVLVQEAGAMTVTDQSLRMVLAMNARPNTIALTLRFAMNMVSANWRLDLKKMHDLDRKARVEVTVHHGDLDPNLHLVDPVLDLAAGAMTVTDQSLLMVSVMNVRRSTIVLIPRSAMNTVSANSHLDPQKMHDLDRKARVEVTVHRDVLALSRHLVDPAQVLEAGAMMVTDLRRKW